MVINFLLFSLIFLANHFIFLRIVLIVPIILCSLREIAVPFNLSKTRVAFLCWVVENSAKFSGLRAVHAAFHHAAELRESFSFGAASTFHSEMQPGPSVFAGRGSDDRVVIRKRKKINS